MLSITNIINQTSMISKIRLRALEETFRDKNHYVNNHSTATIDSALKARLEKYGISLSPEARALSKRESQPLTHPLLSRYIQQQIERQAMEKRFSIDKLA